MEVSSVKDVCHADALNSSQASCSIGCVLCVKCFEFLSRFGLAQIGGKCFMKSVSALIVWILIGCGHYQTFKRQLCHVTFKYLLSRE